MLSLDVWTSEELLRLERERPDPLARHRAELALLRRAQRPARRHALALHIAVLLVALGERLRRWAGGNAAPLDCAEAHDTPLRQQPNPCRSMAALGSVWAQR